MIPLVLYVAGSCGTTSFAGANLWAGMNCDATGTPQISSLHDVLRIFANVVAFLAALAGALAIIFIIVGGIFYITSMGDAGRAKRGREIITWSIGGLVLVVMAEAIVFFISKGF